MHLPHAVTKRIFLINVLHDQAHLKLRARLAGYRGSSHVSEVELLFPEKLSTHHRNHSGCRVRYSLVGEMFGLVDGSS